MAIIERITGYIDSLQRRVGLAGFLYAVVKKYGDDAAGYQAALLTYYGFLSLFPLLLVVSTVAGIAAQHNASVQNVINNSIAVYFPVLGSQLSDHVHTLHKTGFALIAGVLFTLYGARGVADAFTHGVNQIWHIPLNERAGFPKSILKSLSIILVGGAGFLSAAVISGVASSVGRGWAFHVLAAAINLFILFWVFVALLNLGLPKHVSIKEIRAGAATAAIGLVVLQAVGGYILVRELKNLDALYSTFAITLGLLFWIYLQAQILYYAIEIANVRANHLWPRSLSGSNLTPADRKTYAGMASKEKAVPEETIETEFKED